MQNMKDTNYLDSEWQRSPIGRFLRWLFSWRTVRRCLLALAALVTLVALLVAEENWRGSRAWARCKAELEAQGEPLDLKAFVPPPVPEEQNMACAPIFKALLEYDPGTRHQSAKAQAAQARLSRLSPDRDLFDDKRYAKKKPWPSLGSFEKSTGVHLDGWQEFYRGNTNYPQPAQSQSAAADVLRALSKFEPDMQELQAAAQRPWTRFPAPYMEGNPFDLLLPHLAAVKAPTRLLVLRTAAYLEAGQPQAALADVKLALRLSESTQSDPILITHLVRIAMLSITLQAVQDGLSRHGWNDAQLAELEKALAPINMLAEYKYTMRGERAYGLAGLDYYQAHGWPKSDLNDLEGGSAPTRFFNILPTGWVCQNKALIARLHQKFTLAAVDEKAQRVAPDVVDQMDKELVAMRRTPHNIFAKLLFPAVASVSQKSARAQTLVNQARIACALERYRLAHGQWPDKLEAMVPPFLAKLPHDLMDGQPLRYRTEDGGYVLYSVAWNQRDDGGNLVFRKDDPKRVDPRQGDWVWRMPLK